jgi:hypothetical protein
MNLATTPIQWLLGSIHIQEISEYAQCILFIRMLQRKTVVDIYDRVSAFFLFCEHGMTVNKFIVIGIIVASVCGSPFTSGRGCLTRERVRRGEAHTHAQPSGETTLMQPQKNPTVPRNSRSAKLPPRSEQAYYRVH